MSSNLYCSHARQLWSIYREIEVGSWRLHQLRLLQPWRPLVSLSVITSSLFYGRLDVMMLRLIILSTVYPVSLSMKTTLYWPLYCELVIAVRMRAVCCIRPGLLEYLQTLHFSSLFYALLCKLKYILQSLQANLEQSSYSALVRFVLISCRWSTLRCMLLQRYAWSPLCCTKCNSPPINGQCTNYQSSCWFLVVRRTFICSRSGAVAT